MKLWKIFLDFIEVQTICEKILLLPPIFKKVYPGTKDI